MNAGSVWGLFGSAAMIALALCLPACGPLMQRDIMDTPFDRSSERAFQDSYARFENEATAEQSGRLATAVTAVHILVFIRAQIPEDVVRHLCRRHWPVSGALWESLGGHTPNEIIAFGEEIDRRVIQPLQR